MKLSHVSLGLLLFVSAASVAYAQDPTRFQSEIEALNNKEFNIDPAKQVVVFTGSSSVRMWNTIQEDFPSINAINTGFGGSHFTDLIQYQEELIFRFNPDKIFIYEGDNDVSAEKAPVDILVSAAMLYGAIRTRFPEAEIYLISPKPSISRWHLKNEYEQTNGLLKRFCELNPNLTWVDVWSPMLGENGEPKADIFLEDDLHMNAKGYDIWQEVMADYFE